MKRLLAVVALVGVALLANPLQAQSWTFLGPGPVTNGQVRPIGPVSGAIRSILVDPAANSTYYIGSVNGGVWKTTNSGTSWTALTDNMGSTSIGGLSFDALSSNTLVAGFGRFSSNGGEGSVRKGLIYSTNGGTNWTPITNFTGGPNISSVYSRGLTGPGTGTIVAAANESDQFNFTNSGLFRSTNGGNTWSNLFNGGASGLPSTVIPYSVHSNSTNDSQLFTSARFASQSADYALWRSNDTGATWTKVSNATMQTQIEATGANGNVIVQARGTNAFVAIIGNTGTFSALWRSTDGGSNWTQFGGALPDTNPGGQGGNVFQHFNMIMDPTDASGETVYLTGDRTSNSPFTGRVFRFNFATGISTQLFDNANNAPHADGRALAVRPDTGILLHGSDGGIATLTNPTGAFGTWNFAANGNLGIMELHNVAYDPVNNLVFGGTQDNGSVRQVAGGGAAWQQTFGGDGGQVAVVRNPSNSTQSIRYYSSQFFGGGTTGFFRATYDNAGNQLVLQNPSLLVSNPNPTGLNLFQFEAANGDGIQFYGPIATNRADGERFYLGTRRIYESTDRGQNLTVLRDFGSNFAVSAIKADGFTGSTPQPQVLYVAANNQLWYRPDTGGALTQRTAYAATGFITDLAIQPRNWQHIIISNSSQVFRSTNAAGTLTNITGNLLTANPGVQQIYAVETFRVGPDGTGGVDVYFVGGRDGVYWTHSLLSNTWSRLGTGLPNALVTDLDYDIESDTLIVASFGRGVWVIDDVSVFLPIPEPTSLLFVIAPVLGVGALLRRRRAARQAVA